MPLVEQGPGQVEPDVFHVAGRCRGQLVAEESGEVPGAHVQVSREFTERVVTTRVRRHHVGDRAESRRAGRRSLQRGRELGLAARALHVHHQGPGDVARQVGSVVLLDESERQIDAGRHPCRRVRGAVANVDRVGLDTARRVPSGQLVRDPPVRGRPLAVEQAGRGEDERPGADRRDPARRSRRYPRGVRQVSGDTSAWIEVGSGYQQRVGSRLRGNGAFDRDPYPEVRHDVRTVRRHQHDPVVGAEPVRLPEHLSGTGDVQQRHSVVDEDRDAMEGDVHQRRHGHRSLVAHRHERDGFPGRAEPSVTEDATARAPRDWSGRVTRRRARQQGRQCCRPVRI